MKPRYGSIALLLGASLLFAVEKPDESRPVNVGDESPMFILDVLDPNAAGTSRLNLRDYLAGGPKEAKATLVSFYALWCAPCQSELPFLREVAAANHARGLRVMLVSIDKEEERGKLKDQLAAAGGVPFPVLLDPHTLVYRRFRLNALPALYLVGKDGVVRYFSSGFDAKTKEALKAAVAAAL